MTSFLAGSLANAIAAGFRGKLLPGTLRKNTTTSRDSFGDPVSTTADYAVQGLQETYSAPAIGDRVQINGQWFQVRDVKIDPAAATYECQSYRVP